MYNMIYKYMCIDHIALSAASLLCCSAGAGRWQKPGAGSSRSKYAPSHYAPSGQEPKSCAWSFDAG